MDLQSVAAELPRWEPFIRRFRVHDWMRSRIAVEVDDVRQECRLRACITLAKTRAERPDLKGTADEVRIVNRAIARAFVDCVRKANCVSRLLDETAKHTIQSGASWVPAGLSPSLEEEYLAGEHAAAVERACEEVRAIMGDDAYFDVIRTMDGERGGDDPAERIKAKGRRHRAIEKVRRRLKIQQPKKRQQMTDKHANTLNDDDLARVALVYKKIHGAKVTSAARAHLLEKVEAINSDAAGTPFAFPPCFGSAADYDPSDSTCKSECDFRVECGAIIPEHYDPAIEAQLVQLKSGGEVVAPKPPKAASKASPIEPPKALPEIQNPEPAVAVEAAPEAKEPAMTKTKPTKAEKAPKPKKERAVAVTSPGADAAAQAEEDRLNAEDEARAQEATVSSKAKPKKERAVAVTSPDDPAPAKAKAKAKPERKPRPKGKTTLSAPVALSTRPGVLKGKKRATRPDGTPFFRLPQGSAAELAALPVGEKRERDHEGFRYFVKKIADGIMTTGADGVERKRDGTWQLVAKAPIRDDGTVGAKEAIDGVVGTLGVITRFVTGSNVWSAARFWRVIPSLLDPHHPDFNPSKWKPRSVYAYGAKKVVKPPKAKKKAKAK